MSLTIWMNPVSIQTMKFLENCGPFWSPIFAMIMTLFHWNHLMLEPTKMSNSNRVNLISENNFLFKKSNSKGNFISWCQNWICNIKRILRWFYIKFLTPFCVVYASWNINKKGIPFLDLLCQNWTFSNFYS